MSRVFNGLTNNYLSNTVLNLSDWNSSFVMWIKPDLATPASNTYLWRWNPGVVWSLMSTTTTELNSSFMGGGSVSTGVAPTLDAWQLVVATFVPGNPGAFIDANGATIGPSFTMNAFTNSPTPELFLGTNGVGDNRVFLGKIAQFAMFKKALSSADIIELKAGTPADALTSGTADLLDYWPMTDSSLIGVNGGTLAITGTVTSDVADNPPVTSGPAITSITDPAITGTALTALGTGFEASQGTGGTTQSIGGNTVALAEPALFLPP